MASNTLETNYQNGDVIDASHINELTLALLGSLIGRDASGVPTPNQSLGTLALPWGNLYAQGIILNGLALDTTAITSAPNRIVSGKTRPLSSAPDFIRADGSALEFDILGAADNLVLSINNAAVSVISDLNKAGITGAPVTNNTALVNDTTMVNDLHAGEGDTSIIIDAVGTEISSRVGQFAAFETPTGEIFTAFIKNATTLTNAFRGYFFNSSGNPIARGNLSNNDALTFLSTAWVFVEDNGTTVDVTYRTPVVAHNSPTSPSTGDYWFDISNSVWKRYSGTTFEIINRTLIGEVVADSTAVVGSRSYDFNKTFSEINTVQAEIFSTEIVRSKSQNSIISVYGTDINITHTFLGWNITTDLETPLIEAATKDYYLYLSDEGKAIISDKKPYIRNDLKGLYHPYDSYRFVSTVYNDVSSNFLYVLSNYIDPKTKEIFLDAKERQIGQILVNGNMQPLYRKSYDNKGLTGSTGVIDATMTFAAIEPVGSIWFNDSTANEWRIMNGGNGTGSARIELKVTTSGLTITGSGIYLRLYDVVDFIKRNETRI